MAGTNTRRRDVQPGMSVSLSRLLALSLPIALAVAACGDDTDESGYNANASVADRTFLSQSTENFDLVDGTAVSLTFADGAISLNAGCNTMFGDYSIVDGALLVAGMGGTEMGCDQPLMDQDTKLIDFFMSEPELVLDDNDLSLSADGAVIRFLDREVADPDRPIEGTTWVVDGMISNDAVSSVGTVATLTIVDGVASVNAGCNTGSAEVTIDDGTLTFGPLAATRMMCDDEAMVVENAVLATLSGTVIYTIEADTLTLQNGANGLQLRADS